MITVINRIPEYGIDGAIEEVAVKSCADNPCRVFVSITAPSLFPVIQVQVDANDLINAVKNATNTGY